MATELARMARWDGDDHLASALKLAAELAAQAPRSGPGETEPTTA